ncbi:RluA family pseudouridine synthase [Aquibacillus rhizosphaerae]|uniref:Pseudouridine synthase n=1 Tax=Aquibacillus rhizosphaerae TaxID=3051431 RepID=A0ABT7LAP5_9BACI|nr:RluA family pseudouridine synthase [Aquibacillus sp. LR5S19]MDL4842938.1 RluA family pseudouridine synthase [Aquibacillus sp. LR5S19]
MLLREYLSQVGGFSRRIIKVVKFQGGSLLVNGEIATVRRMLKVGDEVDVIFPVETRGAFMKPENMTLDIIYEDQDVMVINKPAGIATIPSLHHPSGTIANGILGYYEAKQIAYTVHIVTRLDRDTSGLLLIAKHRFSHSLLSSDQKQGKVNRRYFAIIEGGMSQVSGVIDAPIARHPDSIIERVVADDGQRAVTHYHVEKESESHSLLDVKLETGRTHQIRVHFSYLGFPLAGDDLYGGSKAHINRQALHCRSLTFTHPISRKELFFSSPIPEDMSNIINK